MRPAAAEQPHEELGEVLVDLLEGRQQALAPFAVEAGDALAQPGDGGHQVLAFVLHPGDLLA